MKSSHYMKKSCKFIDSTEEIVKSYAKRRAPKRNRIKLSDEQLQVLEDNFLKSQHPSTLIKEKIAKDLFLPIKNVQIWFQNRRARRRTEKELAQNEYEKRFRGMSCAESLMSEEELRIRDEMERYHNNETPTWYEDNEEIHGDFYINEYVPDHSYN